MALKRRRNISLNKKNIVAGQKGRPHKVKEI